jgi:hypothetical protein
VAEESGLRVEYPAGIFTVDIGPSDKACEEDGFTMANAICPTLERTPPSYGIDLQQEREAIDILHPDSVHRLMEMSGYACERAARNESLSSFFLMIISY